MSNSIRLSLEDYKKLVNGKFRSFTCTLCAGKGWYWVHDDGTIRNPEKGEEPEEFYQHACEECDEAGFNVVYNED